jgi:hypothetical protein
VENNTSFMYTEEQLMARLKFFIGICLALTLTGIVFVVLFSIIFVTQPLNAISPIDSKFFELIIPIATFLTGTLSGIMLAGNDKDLRAKALDSANRPYTPPPAPPSTPKQSDPVFNSTPATFGGGFNAPVADMTAPQVVTGFGGKPAPAPAPQPLI